MSEDGRVLIWSHEHGAYWGPNAGGYSDVFGAGIYDRPEAERILRGVGPEKGLAIQPLAAVMAKIKMRPGTVLAALWCPTLSDEWRIATAERLEELADGITEDDARELAAYLRALTTPSERTKTEELQS